MRHLGFAALALTAGALITAGPAAAAPTGTRTPHDVISSLEAQGYRVVVNRLSARPLAEADVISIGKGASFPRMVFYPSNDGARQPAPVTAATVFVNVR
ncbi:hypothetical protein BCA37_08890 [Mycobacterium sp. djl-10]|nr:hypothetical protein BCA37_08890 [Mycobacterium sp. djl-10]